MKGAAALLAGLVVLGACSGGKEAGERVPVVVPGPASAWSAVTATAGATSADVPAGLRASLAPLRAARALEHPGPPSDYGLDRPRATIAYRPASNAGAPAPAEVDVGNLNFDRHFVYAQRRGRATVYLVPSDTLRPALALVGIDDKPPTD